MSLPFFKADTDEVIESLTTREWSKDRRPMPFECRMEASAVVAADLVGQWSKKRWARRWCCHHTTVERRLAEVLAFMDEHGGDEWWAPVEGRRRSRRDVFLRAYPFVEGSESRTPSAPRAHPERTPGAPPDSDTDEVVDESPHPERTPSAPRAHPKRTHRARVSPETGEGRQESSLSPKPPQPPAEGAQGQLDLVGPDQALAQVEGMLQRLGVAERVKPDAREGLRDQELLSEAQLAALSPKALRAVPGVGSATAKRLRSALVRAGFTPAEEPKKDLRAARLAGGIWGGLWRSRTGQTYDWRFKRDGRITSDEEHAEALAGLVGVDPEDGQQQEPLQRLHRAMRAYLEAWDQGRVYPPEKPPTFARFAEAGQEWLQVGDGLVDATPRTQGQQGFTDMQDEARRYREEMLRGGSVTPIPALKVVT